ncbi:hypothetical protein G3N59_08175 [Paraburkholderia sp. Ac-20340]|uniref:hypothetical protein n=1 Tax=Paraburkholderia sp. Ac-20340 TaxID=2703888 RepID=UPI00197CC0E4|nr:hypothetical protein [Paraburkholderia sp. Ac-20340]MBN3853349.1 hypothetical protein [Paraburkholderia sp. Ac-20340]
MIKKILAGMAAFGISTVLCAKSPENIKYFTKEAKFSECHFKITDPYSGTLTVYEDQGTAYYNVDINKKVRRPFETRMQFSCESATDEKTISQLAGMKKTNRGWAIDQQSGYTKIKGAHTTFYSLKGKGWRGGGVSMDDINGDEGQRNRVYTFCIIHQQVALCGAVSRVAYLKHLNESVLPQVIKILNSIEFIDDLSVTTVSPVASL